VDQNFIKIAEKNIKRAGVSKYVTQYNLDIKTAKSLPLDLGTMDVALIDLGDPWTVIPQVRELLKGSGSVFAICPTMNQLEKLTISLVANEFTDIESTEHILRTIEAREGKTRHSFQGIGHTTYLCFARKAFFDRNSRSPDKSDDDTIKDTIKTNDGYDGVSSKKTRTKPAKEDKPSKKTMVKKPIAKKTTRKKT
jgi:tRNA (adenine57-N1/adenine58-N1)-methyltransferase